MSHHTEDLIDQAAFEGTVKLFFSLMGLCLLVGFAGFAAGYLYGCPGAFLAKLEGIYPPALLAGAVCASFSAGALLSVLACRWLAAGREAADGWAYADNLSDLLHKSQLECEELKRKLEELDLGRL